MSAHAATGNELFDSGPGALRASLDARRTALVAGVAALAIAALVTTLPGAYAAVADGVGRLGEADAGWLVLAFGLEALSFLGYILLFRAVFVGRTGRMGYGASYDITMAGHAATRLLGAAGAGGIALTVWALRREGMSGRDVATRMLGFMVLLYSVFVLAVIVVGLGLWSGVIRGGGSTALTLIPALIALALLAGAAAVAALARRRPAEPAADSGALRARLGRAGGAVGDGAREAAAVVRRRDPRLLGGVMWWAFDIAVLWASFHAFSVAPPVAVVVLAYFLGQLGNSLPFVGSVGGVDGGLIAAFVAFGVNPAATVVAVIVYRLFSCWGPTIPGALAFARLRRPPVERAFAPQPAAA